MRGDKLLIRKYHTSLARRIEKLIKSEILSSTSRYVVTIAGESGSGKTEIAHELKRFLEKDNIKTITIHLDDYFRYPPKTNYEMRRRDISRVGSGEVNLSLLGKDIRKLKDPKTTSLKKPLSYFEEDKIKSETIKCNTVKVIIVDGTYTTLLKNADKKIFLARTYKETRKARLARKRDRIDSFDAKILKIEHGIISRHKKLADIVAGKDYKSLLVRKPPEKEIKRICMLNTHGYVDAEPVLGKTDTGGQVTYVLEMSKAMAKTGIKVDIYTRRFQNRKKIEQVCKGVRIIRIPCGGKKFIPKERLYRHLDTFVNNMAKFIQKEGLKYDIVHSHYWDSGYVAMKITEKLGSHFFHTFHSLGAWKKEHMGGDPVKMERLYNFKERIKIERMIFRKARAIVMTSTEMIRHSKRFYGYRSKNYIVLPAGVNTEVFRPLKKGEKEKKIDVPQNYVFWVGRFDTNKGLDYLLRSFADAVSKIKDLFLVLGGGSRNPSPTEKDLRKELIDIINTKRINSRVFFVHHIKNKDMPGYYRKAKFFVLPSKFEPFGMTGAEAMACGTASIISRRAGIRKYLKNRRDALFVNISNKKDLCWAFQVLNRNRTFRQKIARNGLKIARNEFSWNRIAKKLTSYYDQTR